jgi:hypothetical protein
MLSAVLEFLVQILQGSRRTVSLLNQLLQKVTAMSAQMDDLTAKVHANTDLLTSAVTLIQGLKTALDAAIASGDPAQLQALSDELGTSDAALAAAIAANTPAASAPTP